MGRNTIVWATLVAACGSGAASLPDAAAVGDVAAASRAADVRRAASTASASIPWTPAELEELLGARHTEDLPSNAILARRTGASAALAALAGSLDVAPIVSARAMRVWVGHDAVAALPTLRRVALDVARPPFERAAAIGGLSVAYTADPAMVTATWIDLLRDDASRTQQEVLLAIEGAPWRPTFVDAVSRAEGLPASVRAVFTGR
jgi:hypothetical protein